MRGCDAVAVHWGDKRQWVKDEIRVLLLLMSRPLHIVPA